MCLNIDIWLTVYNHSMMWLSARWGPITARWRVWKSVYGDSCGYPTTAIIECQSTVNSWSRFLTIFGSRICFHGNFASCNWQLRDNLQQYVLGSECSMWLKSPIQKKQKFLWFLKSTIGFARSKFLRRCESKPAVPTIPEWSPTSVLSRPMTA